MEDFDRKRATNLVLKDATQRLLSAAEVKALRDTVLTADMEVGEEGSRGVALAVVQKAENGHVLTWPEAVAVADAIEAEWQDKPMSGGFGDGVRDTAVTCKKCACRGKKCPECNACAFSLTDIGAYQTNSLSRPSYSHGTTKDNWGSDCGCNSGL